MSKRELFPGGPQVSSVSISLSAPPTASLPLANLAILAPDNNAPDASGEAATSATLQRAAQNGVNLIDSDWITANGHAQEILGRAFSDQQVTITSKVGPRLDFKGQLKLDNSRGNIINQVQDSLFRLKRDRIDLLQVHWPDDTDPSQTARGLEDACHGGLARYVGVCNYSADQLKALMEHTTISTAQSPLSILNRAALDDVLPVCREFDIGFLACNPLQSGLLQGQFKGDEQFTEDDHDAFFRPEVLPKAVQTVAKLEDFAKSLGMNAAQLSVAWCLNQEGVSAVLCPAIEDFESLQKVDEVRLSADELASIDAIVADGLA
ncbi:MAG: aldo/keto reductase [Planctomycetota bacterium]|jgi:aryl-alcohol dehydrogenase-like predicted oxidoreductase